MQSVKPKENKGSGKLWHIKIKQSALKQLVLFFDPSFPFPLMDPSHLLNKQAPLQRPEMFINSKLVKSKFRLFY